MSGPDHFRRKGEYLQHDYGSFVIVELKDTHELHVYSPENKIPITWRSASYYHQRGVPSVKDLKGKSVCEIGPGLAEFALLVPTITIIDPIDYASLGSALADVSNNTSDEKIHVIASSLAARAYVYETVLGDRHIQLPVQNAITMNHNLRGQFDIVVSAHVSEHYGWTSGFRSSVNALGNSSAKFFVL